MCAATVQDRIVGMCAAENGLLSAAGDIPWVTCVFVSEEFRGQRISEKLIASANRYAAELGFDRTYIPTEFVGLYEKYGYRFLREITNYGGTDRLLMKTIGSGDACREE